MKEAAEAGYLNAMAAATYLSNKGVPFRKAHEIVGNAVRLGLESGRELGALELAELRGVVAGVWRGFLCGHYLGSHVGLPRCYRWHGTVEGGGGSGYGRGSGWRQSAKRSVAVWAGPLHCDSEEGGSLRE